MRHHQVKCQSCTQNSTNSFLYIRNVDTPPAKLNDIYVQHTMHRISDPKVSLPFYTEALGMTLLDTANLVMDTSSKFTMFFLAYENPENIPIDDEERRLWAMSYPGAINLQ